MVLVSPFPPQPDLGLTEEIMSSKERFRDWFTANYLSRFGEKPFYREDFDYNAVLGETTAAISRIVSNELYGEDISQRLANKSRKGEISLVRKLTSYFLHVHLRYPKGAIGRMMNKTHATVFYHVKHIKDRLYVDKAFARKFSEMTKVLVREGLINPPKYAFTTKQDEQNGLIDPEIPIHFS